MQDLEFQITWLNYLIKHIEGHRYLAMKRYRKLDAIHQCTCEECIKERQKFEYLASSIEVHDKSYNVDEILKKVP